MAGQGLTAPRLTRRVFRDILPAVAAELARWRKVAEAIPDEPLRRQALASLERKRFHAQGGSVYALLVPDRTDEFVRLIVALQTISDYLDNLCDRSDCTDLTAYRDLHRAMLDAVDVRRPAGHYYRYYPYADDGGYLDALVATCRQVVSGLPSYRAVRERVCRLLGLYNDLQVYKHGPVPGRVHRLSRWFAIYRHNYPYLHWWEFAAASGSTLGAFALLVLAASPDVSPDHVQVLEQAYFPWIGAWHILLDYFIDQEEDEQEGDLNLVSYYRSVEERDGRLALIFRKALQEASALPSPNFHRWVVRGLPALYLSDPKVPRQRLDRTARRLLWHGGLASWGLYTLCRMWRRGGMGPW